MNTRAFTLALLISLIAVFMTNTYIDTQQAKLTDKYGELISVVVAKKDIKEFELIDERAISLENVPKNYVAPGSFRKLEELRNTIATVPIKSGEQITKPRVTLPGQQTGLSRQVSVGKRAFSFPVNESQSIAKLIKPGDRVDILIPVDLDSGRKDRQKIRTILQDVLILSTGQNVTNSLPLVGIKGKQPTNGDAQKVRIMNLNTSSRYQTLTLELDPYQVQKLTWALNYFSRRPAIALRNNNDKKKVRIAPTGIFDLLEEEASEAKAFFKEKYESKGDR